MGSDLQNFADNKTGHRCAETVQDLIKSLEIKTSKAIQRIENNDMIANPEKLKAIVLTKQDDQTAGSEFNFSGRTIYSSTEVDLLGVKLYTKLSVNPKFLKCARKQLDS